MMMGHMIVVLARVMNRFIFVSEKCLKYSRSPPGWVTYSGSRRERWDASAQRYAVGGNGECFFA